MGSPFAKTPSISGPFLWTPLMLQVVEAVLADSDWWWNLQTLDFRLKPTAPVEENKLFCENGSSPGHVLSRCGSYHRGFKYKKTVQTHLTKKCNVVWQKQNLTGTIATESVQWLCMRGSLKTAVVTSSDSKYNYRHETRNTISDQADQRTDSHLSSSVRGAHVHPLCRTFPSLRLHATGS